MECEFYKNKNYPDADAIRWKFRLDQTMLA